MNKHSLLLTLFALPSLVLANDITGLWKTIDDKTGDAQSHVRITENQGTYTGIIERLLFETENSNCLACKDDRQNQTLEGLEIIRAVKMTDENSWGKGNILDPDNGKVYKVKMHTENDGNQLVVRGFLGISLLGRSQTWQRVE